MASKIRRLDVFTLDDAVYDLDKQPIYNFDIFFKAV